MKERTRSSSTMFYAQKNLSSGLLHPDHPTLEIHLTSKQRLITGLMRIDSGMKKTKTMKSKELRFTCFKDSLLVVMFLELKHLSHASIIR